MSRRQVHLPRTRTRPMRVASGSFAVEINAACAFHLAPAFRSDPDVMLLALSKEPSMWVSLVSDELWEDRAFALKAIVVAPGVFLNSARRFRDDRSTPLSSASTRLRRDPNTVRRAHCRTRPTESWRYRRTLPTAASGDATR
mmetsp:Transcript_19693/g.74531  ORF Transcript_19693/g.74531 Transcript_19693/m.74531 type:complete len:142 (+) Transcript_19693:102-527(+)